MPGRRRDNTVGQKKRRIKFKQESFTGQNLDYPASDIGTEKLALLENGVARGVFLESRCGTERFSYAKMPGTGVIYSAPKQHPSSKKWAMHRGTQVWVADQDMHFWQEATAKSDAISGANSTLKPFNEDFLLSNTSGVFLIHLQNTEYFKMNYNCPANRGIDEAGAVSVLNWTGNAGDNVLTLDSAQILSNKTPVTLASIGGYTLPAELDTSSTFYVSYISNTTIKLCSTPEDVDSDIFVTFTSGAGVGGKLNVSVSHKYRYCYTFMRMLKFDGTSASGLNRRDPNTVIINESGTKQGYTADSRDYTTVESNYPISKNNPKAFQLQELITYANSDIDLANNTIALTHEFDTGMQVTMLADAEPFQLSTTYYTINASDSDSLKIKLATTLENALAGTAIDITTQGGNTQLIWMRPIYSMDDSVTHMGIYRTLDVKFSTPEDTDIALSTGTNPEVFSWVGDIDSTDNDFLDSTDDANLSTEMLEGSSLAKMRGMIPLPSGDVMTVAPSWVFTATRNDIIMYYSSITEIQKIHAGHYSPVQFHRYDQGIQNMNVAGDSLLVTTNTQTKPVTLTSFKNVGSLEYIPELDHYPDGDNTTGVTLYGTIAEIEKSTLIAVCSDQSVRIWNGSEWDKDLSWGEVNDEIKTIAPGAVGFFHDSVYYIWYRTDSTLNYNNKCLRLSLDEREGLGWSFFNGNKWVKPPLNTGPSVCEDSNGLRKFICLDHTDEYCYWLETYDSYTGSGLVKTYADKKIDGGFCELGNKFHYDDLDDNNLDTANLTADTDGSGTVTEQNDRVELVSWSTNYAKVKHNNLLTDGYIESSIRNTYWEDSADGDYKWEIKIADDTTTNEVGNLNQGFLAYVTGRTDGEGTYNATWDIKAGATQHTNSVALSARPVKLGVKRENTKITVLVDDKVLTTNTNAVWSTLSNVNASFSATHDNGSQKSGFNAFNVVNANTGASCFGSNGQGSSDVESPHRISSKIRFAEMTGTSKNFNAVHRESHAFFKPPVPLTTFNSGFKVGWKSYQDGGTTPVESIDAIAYNGDIQNWRTIEGRTIQHELLPNMAGWRLTGFNSEYWQEDKKDMVNMPAGTEESDWQEELYDPIFWVSRWTNKDIVSNSNADTESGMINRSPGPDGEGDSAFAIIYDAYLQWDDAISGLGDFTILIGMKGDDENDCTNMPTLKISDDFSVRLVPYLDRLIVRFSSDYYFALPSISDKWNLISLRRTGENLTLDFNGSKLETIVGKSTELTGYVKFSDFHRGFPGKAEFFDTRIFNSVLSDNAIKYWYDNITQGGDKILPV